jgi:hypothetical protein
MNDSFLNDLFLHVDGITIGSTATAEELTKKVELALTWSVNAAIQRNKVYNDNAPQEVHEKLRSEWAKLLHKESEAYRQREREISDEEHCAAIERIADVLSNNFRDYLSGGRLRFGTSQKAFNLYLKYLWALNMAERPPHCPVDSVILGKLGIDGSWTKCDSSEVYMTWIEAIRRRLNLAEWELEAWLRWKLNSDF